MSAGLLLVFLDAAFFVGFAVGARLGYLYWRERGGERR